MINVVVEVGVVQNLCGRSLLEGSLFFIWVWRSLETVEGREGLKGKVFIKGLYINYI